MRLRKKFINNFFFPLGPLLLVLIIIIIIIMTTVVHEFHNLYSYNTQLFNNSNSKILFVQGNSYMDQLTMFA